MSATYRPPEADPVAATALAAAVATLNAAIALKQNSASAATDAELAALSTAVLAAVAGVQTEVDALQGTVATDSELAALASTVATLTAAVATDAELAPVATAAAAALALAQSVESSNVAIVSLGGAASIVHDRGAWAASTAYKAHDLVLQAGSYYSAKVDFTSAASFNPTNWNAIGGGGGGGGTATGTTIGTVALDGSGKPVLTIASIWGISSGGAPYYDPAGAASGEDAILRVADDGSLNLTTITGQVP